MIVKDKIESIKIIKEKKLNSFPEKLFKGNEINKIKSFLKKYPFEYYAIRSKETIGCKENKYKVPKSNILEEIKNFNVFTINVSSYNYVSNFILIGSIMIGKNNEVWITASKNSSYTGRMAEQNPDFNYSTDIFDKKLNDIPGFDLIYGYIIENNLTNVIVEFAVYDKPVGIYNKQIIIFEVRTDF